MARYVRFVVHQRVERDSRRVGLFSAAYYLRYEEILFSHDHGAIDRLLTWFEAELTLPPRDKIPIRAIFWYKNAGPFSHKMWELAQVLDNYGFLAEQITARIVGRVVYEDEHQLAALPPHRIHR